MMIGLETVPSSYSNPLSRLQTWPMSERGCARAGIGALVATRSLERQAFCTWDWQTKCLCARAARCPFERATILLPWVATRKPARLSEQTSAWVGSQSCYPKMALPASSSLSQIHFSCTQKASLPPNTINQPLPSIPQHFTPSSFISNQSIIHVNHLGNKS